MIVFVVMPFADDLTKIYNNVVKPTLEAEGCTVKRADEFVSHQNLLKDIIPRIFEADLIVAELTNKNPNVYYELGIAHSLNKPTILLVQNIEELLFDLASYRAVPYSENYVDIEKLKSTLQTTVHALNEGNGEFGNPVSDHLPGLKISIEAASETPNFISPTKGMVEYAKEAETALYEIMHSAVRQTSLSRSISSNFESYTEFVKYAGSTKSEAIFQQSVLGLNKELEKYGADVAKELPNFRNDWETLKNGLITALMIAPIVNDQDLATLKFLKSQLESLSTSLNTLLPSLKENISILGKFNDKQKSLHPAVSKVQAIQDEQYEIYYIGEAYLARIINLIDRKLSEIE